MPLRNSDDTQESYTRPRPIFRGEKSLNASDIHPFVDISPEAIAAQEDSARGWPQNQETEDEYDLYDTEGPYRRPYVPFIDRKIVDKFPVPPTTTTTTRAGPHPNRPCKRPPTMNMDELDFPDALLPPLTPVIQSRMAALQAQGAAERRLEFAAHTKFQETFQTRQKALEAQKPQRSNSSASSHLRGAIGYPIVLGSYLDRSDAHSTTAPLSIPAKSRGVYANKSHNLSTHSLGPNVHFRAGPVTATPSIVNQPTGARGRNDSSASVKPSIYANSSHNTSTRSLGPSALFRTQRVPVVRQGSSQSAVDPATGTARRSNESSASTKSCRNGAAYQPDVIRVARGPHAAKLHGATPAKAGARFDPDLQVNDSDGSGSGEWGLGPNKAKAATIAGHSRGGFRR